MLWDWIKQNVLGIQPVQPLAPITKVVPPAAATPPATPPSSPAAPQEIDWVGSANAILANTLQRQQVARYGSGTKAFFPITSVNLTGAGTEGGIPMAVVVGHSTVHDHATLTLNLSQPVGNFDIKSINHALHHVMNHIPALKGHYKFSDPDVMNHADVWQQLEPVLAQSHKFTTSEINQLAAYFNRHKEFPADYPEWGCMETEHAEGKVTIRLNPQELKGDDIQAISGEATTIAYFNEHKASILSHFRAKLTALNIMPAEEINALDYNAAIVKGNWGDQASVVFGKHSAEAGATLQPTKLADMNTDKVQECFTSALLESSKELPPIFSRIADGHMVAEVAKHRLGAHNPALNKALEHRMFRSTAELKRENELNANRIELGNMTEGAEPNKLSLTFSLPHGVSLAQLRESIVTQAQHHSHAANTEMRVVHGGVSRAAAA